MGCSLDENLLEVARLQNEEGTHLLLFFVSQLVPAMLR